MSKLPGDPQWTILIGVRSVGQGWEPQATKADTGSSKSACTADSDKAEILVQALTSTTALYEQATQSNRRLLEQSLNLRCRISDLSESLKEEQRTKDMLRVELQHVHASAELEKMRRVSVWSRVACAAHSLCFPPQRNCSWCMMSDRPSIYLGF